MARADSDRAPAALGERLFGTRQLTLDLAAPLSDADATIQPFPDASPAKWHLAHTSWFFETFVLRDHVPGYRPFDDRWAYLFNSYYEAEGPRHDRPRRGMLSRPSLDEVRSYRAHVDEALDRALPSLPAEAAPIIELGINHEQQHQELFLTDILATFAENPLEPAYGELPPPACFAVEPMTFHRGREGVIEIGAPGDGFAFDSERPRHRVFLSPHEIASQKVTNREWREFIDDGGYRTPTLWLSDGWAWLQQEAISSPLYWREDGTDFTLGGRREIDGAAPVAHISHFEADAYARWAGARLPAEAEWEDFAASADPKLGNQLDAAGEAELPHEVGAVALDGADGEGQHLGDLAVGVAPGEEAQHVDLARSERLEGRRRLRGRPGRPPPHLHPHPRPRQRPHPPRPDPHRPPAPRSGGRVRQLG